MAGSLSVQSSDTLTFVLLPVAMSTLSTSLSRLTQVWDISIVAFITAITTGCCCYGWPLWGGHQELSSTRLLCSISCYASINKCSMYCLETSVVRKVKSFLLWTNIKSLARITLCIYFHCVETVQLKELCEASAVVPVPRQLICQQDSAVFKKRPMLPLQSYKKTNDLCFINFFKISCF